MKMSRGKIGLMGVAVAVLSTLAPLTASAKTPAGRLRQVPQVTLSGFGATSPAAANPRRAALLSHAEFTDSFDSGTFRFTPSGDAAGRRAVTVAVRARGVNRTEAARVATASTQLAPSAYNLGIAVGWKRFALSGDIARVTGSALPVNRESAEIGLSYSGNRWNTRVELGTDRALGLLPKAIGADESYSLGLGGSYALTRNLEVTGGVRYKLQRDRIDLQQTDDRRDSQAVYIGTAFKF
jgi:hypothetical protein